MKHIFNEFVSVVLTLLFVLVSSGAILTVEATDDESVCTVYASAEEQRAFMNAVGDEWTQYIIPGSVTPLYFYTIYNYKTDTGYKAGDAIVLSNKSDTSNSFMYVASMKDITLGNDYWDSGFIDTSVKNGSFSFNMATLFPEDYGATMSMNYADYAEDIRALTGREDIIDPRYVRLVIVENFGYCFYINDGVDEFFYRLYSVQWIGHIDLDHGARILRVGEDLERAAREVKEHLERERKIQAGEIESGGSSSLDVEPAVVEFHPATGDTSDIEAYLGVKIDSFKTHFPEAFKAPVVWPYFVAGGAAVAAAAVAVILIAKKRRNRAAGEAPAEAAG